MPQIQCEKHGTSEISEKLYKRGFRCMKCLDEKNIRPKRVIIKPRRPKRVKNTPTFIKIAREIHGDKYDYSQIEYINNKTKVVIICPDHGEFMQVPDDHLLGHGCPKCAGNQTLSTSTFIERAREVHEDKYDYSQIEYINNKTKVVIICPDHGEWMQRPNHHLKGQGCPKCWVASLTSSIEKFIEKAREVHGDKYDYSEVNYTNTHTKVAIICPDHGEFMQRPANHLLGHGCPICAEIIKRAAYLDLPTILYYIKVEHKGMIGYKIGITTNSTMERYVTDIRSGTKITILDEWMYPTGKPAFEKEQSIISRYRKHLHPDGEAMLYSGASELFNKDVLELDK